MVVPGLGEGENGELVFNGIEFPFGNMTVLDDVTVADAVNVLNTTGIHT